MKEVVIVGAGFSGLVAAWWLQRDGFDVTVVEKSKQIGGLIFSQERSHGLVETAANGLLSSKLVEELFEDCGISIQVPRASARNRYIFCNRHISRWPLTLGETIVTILKLVRFSRCLPQPCESLQSWAERALGKAMADKVVATATLGIYAASAENLSANLIVGRFYSKNIFSRIQGRKSGTVSCKGGMGELLRRLRLRLENLGVKFQLEKTGLEAAMEATRVNVPVVLATSAWDAGEIVSALAANDNRTDLRRAALESITSVALNSVTMFFSCAPIQRGFGILFSQNEVIGESDGILGVLQNSEIFSDRVSSPDLHSETWIVGGAEHGSEMTRLGDEEIIELILKKRERMIDPKSRECFLEAFVTRWPRAIPLYDEQLEKAQPVLHKDEAGLILFGNYMGNLGLASIFESVKYLSDRLRSV